MFRSKRCTSSRARARPSGSEGRSGTDGSRSSRYAMITSDSGSTKPSSRIGTRPVTFSSYTHAGRSDRSISTVSYSSPFSASAIRTRAQYGERAREAAVGLGLAVEDRIGDADPTAVRAQLRLLEPRQELRDGPFHRHLVVALHMGGGSILAGLPLHEARIERVERGGHEIRDV